MSEEHVGYTPEDIGPADAAETDPAALTAAEELDEDRLEADPLEAGMDPPERWAEADKYGMTAYEESHPRPLSERLREEEPDVGVAEQEADADMDGEVLDEAVRRGQAADEAGGSMAATIRTPPSERSD
jgi:hypothetical protein